MLMIFYMLLILGEGRCTDDQNFETKTIHVGDDVNLTCPRESSGTLFWIRLVSGNFPKILGKTFDIDTDSRIAASEEPGIFVLHITKAELSDTGVYYCLKTQQQTLIFLKGTELRVKEPDITTVSPSDPVHPGRSVTLSCSVLFNTGNGTCSENHSVCWFRSGPDECSPILIYNHGEKGETCERSPPSLQKCVYDFSKNISSSDAGTYYCAVATCGQILFGNKTKLDIEVVDIAEPQRNFTVLFLLCVALAISLIVIAFLIASIKAHDAGTATTGQNEPLTNLRRDKNAWIYSAVIFTVIEHGCGEIKGTKAAEKARVDDTLRAFGLD